MLSLRKREMSASRVMETENGWRLCIEPGPAHKYRWAQLDDYLHLPRRAFPWQPPLVLELRARVSQLDIDGTWGFGFWNDPFSASLGAGGTARRLPALPNTAWFFYASPPNYLAFRDDHPAQGFLMATFRSPLIPPPLLGLGLPLIPLLSLPAAARPVRRMIRQIVHEAGAQAPTSDLTAWHAYRMELGPTAARFFIDGTLSAETTVIPKGRLGFVLWIDNQYAAFPSDGRLRYGTLETRERVWLEVEGAEIKRNRE